MKGKPSPRATCKIGAMTYWIITKSGFVEEFPFSCSVSKLRSPDVHAAHLDITNQNAYSIYWRTCRRGSISYVGGWICLLMCFRCGSLHLIEVCPIKHSTFSYRDCISKVDSQVSFVQDEITVNLFVFKVPTPFRKFWHNFWIPQDKLIKFAKVFWWNEMKEEVFPFSDAQESLSGSITPET